MEIFRGIAVFSGLAIGRAFILEPDDVPVSRHRVAVEGIDREITLLDTCLARLAEEIGEDERAARDRFGREISMIFEAQRSMLLDKKLRDGIVDLVKRDQLSAELGTRRVLREYISFFRGLRDSSFADRAADLIDLERRLLGMLTQQTPTDTTDTAENTILIARDLTPSQTAALDRNRILGFATASGGRTSHTAILAGAMEIPAVVGLGDFLEHVQNGQMVILDASDGTLIIDPDQATIDRYKKVEIAPARSEIDLKELRDLPSVTSDGEPIELMANIEFPNEAAHCLEMGANGIGLYRTEFLYLDSKDQPTEEEQFLAYKKVLDAMGPERPVIVRTLDLGADKVLERPSTIVENNPVLGLRSIRLSLREVGLFKRQLRALIRSSIYGNLRIMFPLVTTVMELRRCRLILADVMEDLQEEGIPFRRDIPIGMMVEVPSAALLADQFARLVDFFSIGTNDLIQYTLAADRTNENLATLYSASDPAVLKLVRTVIRAAERHQIEVCVCGEMSGDPIYAPLLIGLGLRQMSLTPHKIPEIKKLIRGLTLKEAQRIAGRVQRLDNARDITSFLRDRVRRIAPELVHGLD
ncbi:phosphoenolpyruvate--protein phosphotransferase [bacterium]|nr:phosphoenolpyruvate--protein phosphotransferase [bacterium]